MNHLENAPETIKNTLIHEMTKWKSSSRPIKNEHDAYCYIFESIEYSFRMLWIHRQDKLNTKEISALDWATQKYINLPYNPKEIAFQGQDHHFLSKMIVDSLWNDYLTLLDNHIVKPPIENKSFFKKFFR